MSSIGQPLSRADGRLKVIGGALYTADIPLPELVYAVVVQSTITRGRITHIDTRAAEAVPGVLAVITHLNAPRLSPAPVALGAHGRQRMMGPAAQSHLPLQDEQIYYNGQHIGIVIAETFEQATNAGSLVHVEYAQETPLVQMDDALSQAYTPENVWGEPADTKTGDITQGVVEAHAYVEQTYTTAMQHHNTMEPHATTAFWEDGKLTLYEPSTWVYGVRKAAATWFGIPEEDVRVVQHFVGGSFGCKGPTWPHVALTAMAARQVGRPVRLVLSRQQTFTSVGYRPEIRHHITLGATQEGRLTAIVHDAVAQNSPFDRRAVAPVTKTTRKLYACPNIATTYRLLPMNMGGPFTMRGPGETPGLFALESAMDELAYALHMDPIELRLRNYAENDPETGQAWSSKSLRECYRRGAEHFCWHRRNPTPRSMRDGDELVGYGMATEAYDAKASPAAASAQLQTDGSVLVQSATCDQGTGSYTTMRQIAADALDLPIQQVHFELGDTRMPMAPISAGSMTSASVGSAVHTTASALRRKILSMACAHPSSPLYSESEEQITTSNGHCFLRNDPNKGLSYRDVLSLYQQEKIEVIEHITPDEESSRYSCYSFGAHFAEVRVHPDTGEVRVSRFVGCFGAGRILNPKTAHSQLIGGIVWGIGMALMEQTLRDPRSGRIVNPDLAEYHVPVNADIPPIIDAFFIEEHDPHVNLLGVKGLGEIGTIGAAAAVANAVYHATGKRIRDLPITPDKLL